MPWPPGGLSELGLMIHEGVSVLVLRHPPITWYWKRLQIRVGWYEIENSMFVNANEKKIFCPVIWEEHNIKFQDLVIAQH